MVTFSKLKEVYTLSGLRPRKERLSGMEVNSLAEFGRSGLSQLDYTYDLLSGLSDDELEAVQKVALVFIKRNTEKMASHSTRDIVPFQPQTEEQLFERIDRSLAQVDAGLCEDLDDVVNEMLAEFET